MIWDWLFRTVKDQGIEAVGVIILVAGVVILFWLLLKFWRLTLNQSLERENRLNEIIENHLSSSDTLLLQISKNLEEGNKQHTKMTEILIKINERTKRG